jgi:hypothetical protein
VETSPIALCGKIIIDALGVVSKIGKQHGIRIEMPDPFDSALKKKVLHIKPAGEDILQPILPAEHGGGDCGLWYFEGQIGTFITWWIDIPGSHDVPSRTSVRQHGLGHPPEKYVMSSDWF